MAATNESRDFLAELISAAAANDVDKICRVFQDWEDAGATSPPKEKHGYPLLHFTPALGEALRLGNLEALDEFFRRGLPPDMEQFGSESWMGLNKGSTEENNWNIKTYDFLLSRGWDINYYWGHLGDILAQSACKSKIPLVKYLLSKGADPNLNEKGGCGTPVECAALMGNAETLSLLLAYSPLEEINRSSALLLSAQEGDIGKVSLVLATGADINGIPDNWRLFQEITERKDWGTALHVAAAHNRVSCIAYLVEKGARKDIKNPAGLTPREVAEEFGHEEAANLLK